MFDRSLMVMTACFSICFSGCSTHPLPEDMTRKNTYDIVERLRCEVSVGVLASGIPPKEYPRHFVGYDFTMDITENNKLEGGVLEFTHLITGGNLKVALNGGLDKKRQNQRFFRLYESFDNLIQTTHDKCDGQATANLLYPIIGAVGLDEAAVTYGRLGRLSKFRMKGDDSAVFSDTLTFTTRLTAGIKPTLTVAAAGSAVKLTNATLNKVDERVDQHKVAIAMAPAATAGFGREMVLRDTRSSIIREGNPAATVIQELDRLRSRDEDIRLLQQLRSLQ
jgi:hypothetical protein